MVWADEVGGGRLRGEQYQVQVEDGADAEHLLSALNKSYKSGLDRIKLLRFDF